MIMRKMFLCLGLLLKSKCIIQRKLMHAILKLMQRITIASFYKDGSAFELVPMDVQQRTNCVLGHSLQALQLRFAPSEFEDPQGVLFKLTQTSLVMEYQTQFEMLSNRVIVLSPHSLLSFWVSIPIFKGRCKLCNLIFLLKLLV